MKTGGLNGSQRMDVDGTPIHDPVRLSKRLSMDVSLWERLPENLVEKIVSRLRLRDIFRLRAVCRRWNSLIKCPGYGLLRAREGVPSEGPWFLMSIITHPAVPVDPIAAYYPSANKWHWIWQPTTIMLFQSDCMSSDGGLICYYDFTERDVVVVNPLTGAYRRLPRDPMNTEVDNICLMADRATRSYQVISIGTCEDEATLTSDKYNIVLDVYHSSSNSWNRVGNKSPPLSISGMVEFNGSGFLHVFDNKSSEILVFSLDEPVWRRIEVPFLRSVSGEHAVQWQERLLIIAGKADVNDNGSWNRPLAHGICVWELHKASSKWVLVDRMPDSLFQEVAHRDEGDRVFLSITSVANCSLVLLIVARYNRDGRPVRSVTSFKTVLYNLEKEAWTMVECCPVHGLEYLGFNIIGYEPGLDAMFSVKLFGTLRSKDSHRIGRPLLHDVSKRHRISYIQPKSNPRSLASIQIAGSE